MFGCAAARVNLGDQLSQAGLEEQSLEHKRDSFQVREELICPHSKTKFAIIPIPDLDYQALQIMGKFSTTMETFCVT